MHAPKFDVVASGFAQVNQTFRSSEVGELMQADLIDIDGTGLHIGWLPKIVMQFECVFELPREIP